MGRAASAVFMVLGLAGAAAAQEEKVRVTRASTRVAIVTVVDPAAGEPAEARTPVGAAAILASSGRAAVVHLPEGARELTVVTRTRVEVRVEASRFSDPDLGRDVSHTQATLSSQAPDLVTVQARVRCFVVVEDPAGPPRAGIIEPDSRRDFPAAAGATVVIVTEDGRAWRGPAPIFAAAAAVALEWTAFGRFRFASAAAGVDWTDIGGYESRMKDSLSFGGAAPVTVLFEAEDYDVETAGGWLRVGLDWFDLTFRYADDDVDGEGKVTIINQLGTTVQKVEFDGEWRLLALLAGRSLGGLHGPGWRVDGRVEIGPGWIREEVDEVAVFGVTLALSDSRSDVVAIARALVQGQVELGAGFFLDAFAGGESHLGRGSGFTGGLGVGRCF